MFIPEVATGVAANAVTDVVKRGIDLLRGPEERRALRAVFASARISLKQRTEEQVDRDTATVIESILDDFIPIPEVEALLVERTIGAASREGLLSEADHQWLSEAFDDQGFDAETIPLPLEHLLDDFATFLWSGIRSQSEAKGGALHRVRITRLMESGNASPPPINEFGFVGGPRPSYADIVKAFRSTHPHLHERGRELNDVLRLIRHGGYVVIEGDAWAGKTAFMVHLADRLRSDGVDVVQFFVVNRDSATVSRFYEAATPQLLDLLGADGGLRPGSAGLRTQFNESWAAAMERAESSGVPLVLLVDAVDEQDPEDPISSRLPLSSSAGPVSVVVATRPNPGFRHLVPSHHDLALLGPERVYELQPSPYATADRRKAERAIAQYLSGTGDLKRDLMGFLAIARGSLSAADLAELCVAEPGAVKEALDPLGRHLRILNDGEQAGRWAFAHAELVSQAQEWFGPQRQQEYVGRVVSWGDLYAAEGWPPNTPLYLVQSLDAVVRAARWLPDWQTRTIELQSDQRATRMRARLGHTQPMLETIALTLEDVASSGLGKVDAFFELCVREFDLTSTSTRIPTPILAGLASVDRAAEALNIAHTIPDASSRDAALSQIAEALVPVDLRQSLDVADDIDDHEQRSEALARIASSLVLTDAARAAELARAITDPTWRAWSLAQLAHLTGNYVLADEAADALSADAFSDDVDAALSQITQVLAPHDPMRASKIARSVAIKEHRERALVAVVRAFADNDTTRALEIAQGMHEGDRKAEALAQVSRALATDHFDDALMLARSITTDAWQAHALAQVAEVANNGDIASEAVDVARRVTDGEARAWALAQVAFVTADASVVDDALDAVHGVTGATQKAKALADVARALAKPNPDRALDVARDIADNQQRFRTQTYVAEKLAQIDPTRAREVARSITDASSRAQALAQIAEKATDAATAHEALQVARSITNSRSRPRALEYVTRALATSDPTQAIEVARSISDNFCKTRALAQISQLTNDEAIAREALQVARSIVRPVSKSLALAHAATANSDARIADEAVEVAQSIEIREHRDRALAVAARALATHRPDDAVQLARRISNPGSRAWALAHAAGNGDTSIADEATEVAHHVRSRTSRARALAQVAHIVGDKSAAERATTVARDEPDIAVRARALAQVAQVTGDSSIATEAIAAAHGSPDAHTTEQALSQVVRALALWDPDRALAVAGDIESNERKASALLKVVETMAESDPQRAIGVARTIVDVSTRAHALAEVARATGDSNIINEALEAAHGIEANAVTGRALLKVVGPLARRDPDLAFALVQGVPIVPENFRTISTVAAAVAASDPAQALRIARSIPDAGARVPAIAQVATATGDPSIIDEAIRTAESISAKGAKARALREIAVSLSEYDPAIALRVACTIGVGRERATALSRIAGAAGSSHIIDEVLDAADSIDDDESRAWSLAQVAGALAETDPNRALELSRSIENSKWKAWALAQLPRPASDSGVAKESVDAIRRMTHGERRAQSLVQIARTLAEQTPVHAIQVANCITDTGSKAYALAQIAQVTGDVDLADEAVATARTMTSGSRRPAALAKIVPEIAKSDPVHAQELVQGIHGHKHRTDALRGLVAALAPKDPAHALEVAHGISNDRKRAEALAQVAGEMANRNVARALEIAQGINQGSARVRALALVARAADDSSIWDAAMQAARDITDDERKSRALIQISELAEKSSLLEEVIDLADGLEDRTTRARIVSHMTKTLARFDAARAVELSLSIDGHAARARALADVAQVTGHGSVFDKAVKEARAIGAIDRRDSALAAVVHRAAECAPRKALKVARSITQSHLKAGPLTKVAIAYAAIDQARAREVVGEIDGLYRRSQASAQLAGALADVDVGGAIGIATSISEIGSKAWALAQVAAVTGDQAVLREAIKATRAVANTDAEARSLMDVARTLAALATTQAIEVAHSIIGTHQKATALSQVAVKLARSDPDRALDVASGIASQYQKARALAQIAQIIAETDPAKALEVTRGIDASKWKAQALAHIALGLSQTDPLDDKLLWLARRWVP